MTLDIALTFGILVLAVIVFIGEWIRADLVALLVLVALVLVGLVSAEESISGFSNSAVISIWAVFILSAGLTRTGVSLWIGRQVLRLAGSTEKRLLAVLMSASAAISAFVCSIGVAAIFLPVSMDIARRTKRSPSRLLLPMAYSCLIGGMLTLIGTSSNLVVIDFLTRAGFESVGLFGFAPVGLVILVVAAAYTLTIGIHLLPERKTTTHHDDVSTDFPDLYGLSERLAVIEIPDSNPLVGKTLAESRFGRALGLNVLRVQRKDGLQHVPAPDLTLEGGDRLLVLGRLDAVDTLSEKPALQVLDSALPPSRLVSDDLQLAEMIITDDSSLAEKTVTEAKIRSTLGLNLLAVRRGDTLRRTNLQTLVLHPGDRLLLQGLAARMEPLSAQPGFNLLSASEADLYKLNDRLLYARIPEGSPLAGRTLAETHLAAAFGISVLNVIREGEEHGVPDPETPLQANDRLVIEGRTLELEVLRGLQNLKIERTTAFDPQELDTDPMAVVEVMLSPHTSLAGKTLRELRFRDVYGVSVLAVWRGETPYRTRVADIPLRFGDAILCYGRDTAFDLMARERDLVVLRLESQEPPRRAKAPLAVLIMAAVVAVVLLGWLTLPVAGIAGAAALVLTRCLTMDEVYHAVEWKVVFLVAAMLPLGMAMQRTGAAALMAQVVLEAVEPFGPTAILAVLTALTLMVNQLIPSAVNAVVMTPIALATAQELGVSPYPFTMGIAYAVASSFMTPVSHPANLLVMSPGGYRFIDYIKNGLPLSLIVLVVCVTLLPVIFPF